MDASYSERKMGPTIEETEFPYARLTRNPNTNRSRPSGESYANDHYTETQQPKVPNTINPTNPSTTQATKKTSRYGGVINPNPKYKT